MRTIYEITCEILGISIGILYFTDKEEAEKTKKQLERKDKLFKYSIYEVRLFDTCEEAMNYLNKQNGNIDLKK